MKKTRSIQRANATHATLLVDSYCKSVLATIHPVLRDYVTHARLKKNFLKFLRAGMQTVLLVDSSLPEKENVLGWVAWVPADGVVFYIWTKRKHRKTGVANQLLEHVPASYRVAAMLPLNPNIKDRARRRGFTFAPMYPWVKHDID